LEIKDFENPIVEEVTSPAGSTLVDAPGFVVYAVSIG
jgi:hypothetical protein